jgi:hypothetical protein
MPVPMRSVRFYKKDPESTYGFMTEPTPNIPTTKLSSMILPSLYMPIRRRVGIGV